MAATQIFKMYNINAKNLDYANKNKCRFFSVYSYQGETSRKRKKKNTVIFADRKYDSYYAIGLPIKILTPSTWFICVPRNCRLALHRKSEVSRSSH